MRMPMMPPQNGMRMRRICRVHVFKARLVKNYGLMKMDPYVRLFLGPNSGQTPISEKGGKEPRWNSRLDLPFPRESKMLEVEVYDSRTLGDKKIAWMDLDVSTPNYLSQPEEKWYHLSGAHGDKEGIILLSIHVLTVALPQMPIVPPLVRCLCFVFVLFCCILFFILCVTDFFFKLMQGLLPYQPMMFPPPMQQMQPPQMRQQQQQPPPQPQLNPQHVQQLKEMFPDLDNGVIETVLLSSGNDFNKALTSLLEMQQ
eukprot:m.127687 g.127687  ORF g.127687 m.127687 type:complete len:256 (-) comp13014_c5_seq4:2659-3426(-)